MKTMIETPLHAKRLPEPQPMFESPLAREIRLLGIEPLRESWVATFETEYQRKYCRARALRESRYDLDIGNETFTGGFSALVFGITACCLCAFLTQWPAWIYISAILVLMVPVFYLARAEARRAQNRRKAIQLEGCIEFLMIHTKWETTPYEKYFATRNPIPEFEAIVGELKPRLTGSEFYVRHFKKDPFLIVEHNGERKTLAHEEEKDE